MAIGIQQFAVASLPRWVRILVGVMGVGGNRERGWRCWRVRGAWRGDGGWNRAPCCRCFCATTRATRRRWRCSMDWRRSIRTTICFAWKGQPDQGRGQRPGAIALYKRCWRMRPSRATLSTRGCRCVVRAGRHTARQNDIADAAENYLKAAKQPNCSDWLRKRAQLNAARCTICCSRGRGLWALSDGVVGGGRPVAGGCGAAVDEDTVRGQVARGAIFLGGNRRAGECV